MSNDTYTNARSCILSLNAGDTVGGHYHDADDNSYRATGKLDRSSGRVTFQILSEEGETIGEGFYKKRANPSSNPKAPVAFGRITFREETYGVAVRPATFGDDRKGHTIFPDQMPERVDMPF